MSLIYNETESHFKSQSQTPISMESLQPAPPPRARRAPPRARPRSAARPPCSCGTPDAPGEPRCRPGSSGVPPLCSRPAVRPAARRGPAMLLRHPRRAGGAPLSSRQQRGPPAARKTPARDAASGGPRAGRPLRGPASSATAGICIDESTCVYMSFVSLPSRVKGFEAAGDLLRVLAAPARLAIVTELAEQPRYVHELVDRLGLSQPLVSSHLRVLRNARVVRVDRQGRAAAYSLPDQHVAPLVGRARTH